MTQKKIRLIIGLMTLALLGLIAFQAYWLGFMLGTKKEQFASDVQDGLAQVVRKLEKQELVMLAERHKTFEAHQQKIKDLSTKLASHKPKRPVAPTPSESPIAENFIGPEGISNNQRGAIHNEVRSDIMYVRKSFLLPNGQIAEITEEYQVDVDPEQDIQRRLQEDQQIADLLAPRVQKRQRAMRHRQFIKKDTKTRVKNEQLSLKPSTADVAPKEVDKVIQKTALAREVFSDFLFKERPIPQRVEPHYIDSMLRKELAAKHIQLNYAFGIAPQAPKQAKDWIFASNASIKNIRHNSWRRFFRMICMPQVNSCMCTSLTRWASFGKRWA